MMERVYPSSQQGMVLLTTVMMLVIMMMLVLFEMKALWLYRRVNQQIEQTHDAFYDLERATEAMRRHISSSRIVMPCQSSHCQFNANQQIYHYRMTDKGVFPCLVMEQGRVSHHWLLSVERVNKPYMTIWVRFAVPDKLSVCDPSRRHVITAGILSWRYQQGLRSET